MVTLLKYLVSFPFFVGYGAVRALILYVFLFCNLVVISSDKNCRYYICSYLKKVHLQYILRSSYTRGAESSYPSGAPEFTTVISGVHVTPSFVLCVCFVDYCLSDCPFSVGHCVVCRSSIYGF